MGQITNRMHDIIKVFYQTATTVRKGMEEDRATFIPSIAADLCEKAMDALKETMTYSLEGIYSIRDEAVAAVNEWAQLRGTDMTNDAQLLDGHIKLTAKEVAQLAERYKDNYTMSRLIGDYWRSRPEHTGKDALDNLPIYKVETPEQKIERIERLAASAAKTIGDIFNPEIGDPIKNNLMDTIVENWGDGNEL